MPSHFTLISIHHLPSATTNYNNMSHMCYYVLLCDITVCALCHIVTAALNSLLTYILACQTLILLKLDSILHYSIFFQWSQIASGDMLFL